MSDERPPDGPAFSTEDYAPRTPVITYQGWVQTYDDGSPYWEVAVMMLEDGELTGVSCVWDAQTTVPRDVPADDAELLRQVQALLVAGGWAAGTNLYEGPLGRTFTVTKS